MNVRHRSVHRYVHFGLFLSLFLGFTSAQALTVISDIDDTIKLTHVSAKSAKEVKNTALSVLKKKSFTGLAELYQVYEGMGAQFLYLSGSPTTLKKNLTSFIRKNKFPDGTLRLKSKRRDPRKIRDYKTKVLNQELKSFSPPYILIGDDTQYDSEVYAAFQERNATLVDSVYIHRVDGKSVAQNNGVFLTGFDLALLEYNKGRLPFAKLKEVSLLTIDPNLEKTTIAPFQKCSKDGYFPSSTSNEAWDLISFVKPFIENLCLKRERN